MTSVRCLLVLLSAAASLPACGRVVVDDRASEVDDSSASGDPSGSGEVSGNGAGTGGGAGSGEGSGAGAADGGGDAPPVDWPAGPDSEPPAESACRVDLSLTHPSSLDEPEAVALVQRADGYVRLVATGWVDASGGSPRRGVIETYAGVAWWGTTMFAEGSTVEDAGSPAADGQVPLATRGDVTVHVREGDIPALVSRTMRLDYEELRLVTVSEAAHPLPDAQAAVRALALPGDRTALLVHGPATSPGLSIVTLPDAPSTVPTVSPLASLRPCADRPVAFTAAPGAERTAIALATDGTGCAGAAGPPDVVHTAMLDPAGAVLAESAIRVEGPVESLWSTASADARWIALRLAGSAELLIGRIGDDGAIEPVATIPGGADPSIASWNDGLAVVDIVEEELRVRLIDGSGAVVEQAPLQPFNHSRGRPSIVTVPPGVVVAEPAAEVLVGTFVPAGATTEVALKWFDCDL